MNWLFPSFLIGASAVAIPLILHFLRRRPKRPQPFPALRFFKGASPADQRRHRLRRWLVLAMRCGVFSLLAIVFARPFFQDSTAAPGRATIIVIDNSFSLQATDRWEKLRAWTRVEFGRFQPGETIGLLLMNPRPIWLVAPTSDITTAWRTLEQLRPGWHTTHAGPALRFAADTLDASPAQVKRILFVGDHQALGWKPDDFAKTLPPGIAVTFPPIAPNVSVQAALEPPAVTRDGDNVTVQVTVKNISGTRRRTLDVFLADSAKPAASVPVDPLSSDGRTVSVSFPVTASYEWIRCALDPDDLPADDVVYGLIPPSTKQSGQMLLLDRVARSTDADYLATAYEALAALPDSPRVATLPHTPWPESAIVVLRNDASFAGEYAARLDQFLEKGGSALMFFNGGAAQTKWLAAHKVVPWPAADDVRVRDWSIEHPLVAPLAERGLRNLVGWQFARGWSLPSSAVEPIAFWADGSVALGELSTGSGRVLIAGFSADRRDGDWPVEGVFVPFLHRAAAYLFKTPPRSAEAPLRVGDSIALPEGPGFWQNASDTHNAVPLHPVSGRITVSAPGVYVWSSPTGGRELYAVGLDLDESDLIPWSEGTPWLGLVSRENAAPKSTRHLSPLMAREAEQQNGLWWWCLAAAAVFLVSELSLANRTAR